MPTGALVTQPNKAPLSESTAAGNKVVPTKTRGDEPTTHAQIAPENDNEEEMLAAAALSRPSVRSLARVERAAVSDPTVWPRLAAMLLGRNSPGDASRAARLLDEFGRQRSADARGCIRVLLVLARERETHALSHRRGRARMMASGATTGASGTDNALDSLQRELEDLREERDAAHHEAMELRRKLKDLASIEKSMDERKTH